MLVYCECTILKRHISTEATGGPSMNKEKPLPHLRGCRSVSGGHRRGGRHRQGRRDRRGRSCPGTHCCSSSSEVPQNCSPYQTCRKMRKHQVIKFFRGNVSCLFSFTDNSTLSPFASLLLPPSYSFCSSTHIPVFLLLPFHTCIPGSSSPVLFSCSFLSSPVFLLLSLLACIPVVTLTPVHVLLLLFLQTCIFIVFCPCSNHLNCCVFLSSSVQYIFLPLLSSLVLLLFLLFSPHLYPCSSSFSHLIPVPCSHIYTVAPLYYYLYSCPFLSCLYFCCFTSVPVFQILLFLTCIDAPSFSHLSFRPSSSSPVFLLLPFLTCLLTFLSTFVFLSLLASLVLLLFSPLTCIPALLPFLTFIPAPCSLHCTAACSFLSQLYSCSFLSSRS